MKVENISIRAYSEPEVKENSKKDNKEKFAGLQNMVN